MNLGDVIARLWLLHCLPSFACYELVFSSNAGQSFEHIVRLTAEFRAAVYSQMRVG